MMIRGEETGRTRFLKNVRVHEEGFSSPAGNNGAALVGPSFPFGGGANLHAPGSPLESVLRVAEAMARTGSSILLRGESGTGKELLAHYLHRRSMRANGPFVAVNCAAISPGLVESELFGHCRGAFTHAVTDRLGNIRQAHGGTLFLDEVGDMPAELQARFLRVLQEKSVRPVGGDREVGVDFRLVCATHRDLALEVREGRFREDLFFRIRVLELRLPALRERPVDIPYLLREFLTELAGVDVAERALYQLPGALLRYSFPGNVRELRNIAEQYAALHELGEGWDRILEGRVRSAGLVEESRPSYPAGAGVRTSRLNRQEVMAALEACGYHRARAASMLGVTRRTLQYHLARIRKESQRFL